MQPFLFTGWINITKVSPKTSSYRTIISSYKSGLVSERHYLMHARACTSVPHMVADKSTHVVGFVTLIRLIGPSLPGNVTWRHEGLW